MKTLKDYLSLLFIAIVMSAATTACGGDDNDDPTPPPFAEEAVKYIASTNSKDIESIELTAGGEYIIVINDSHSIKPSDPTPGDDDDDLVIRVGLYNVNADGTVYLDGFGSLAIAGTKLTLTTTAGETVNLTVRKANEFAATEINKQLCRTWTTNRLGFALDLGNTTIFDRTEPLNNLETLVRSFLQALGGSTGETPSETEIQAYIKNIKEDLPNSVIFTRAGTMLIRESDGTYDLMAWRWRDQVNSIIEVADASIGSSTPDYDERMIVSLNGSDLTLRSMEVENPGETPQIVSSIIWGFAAN